MGFIETRLLDKSVISDAVNSVDDGSETISKEELSELAGKSIEEIKAIVNELKSKLSDGAEYDKMELIDTIYNRQEAEILGAEKTYQEGYESVISDATNYEQDYAEKLVYEGIIVDVDTIKGTLKKGSRGPQVKTLQQALMNLGYLDSKLDSRGEETATDGIFGGGTESALKAFQKANGLAADGVLGQKTLDELASMSGLKDPYNDIDYTSARDAVEITESMGESNNVLMSDTEASKKVEALKNATFKAKAINSAFEDFFNKGGVDNITKDSGSGILEALKSDDFITYLGKYDSHFQPDGKYYEAAKQNIKNNVTIEQFESNKISNNIKEGAFYIAFVGVPIMTLNITDSQTIHTSEFNITNAINFYDYLAIGNDYIPTNNNIIEDSLRELSNASPEHKKEAVKLILENIISPELVNANGAIFSWSEKNMPKIFGGDRKYDEVNNLLAQINDLVNSNDFNIEQVNSLILQIKNNLNAQYQEEVNEENDIATRNEFIDYLNISNGQIIKGEYIEGITLKQLKEYYPLQWTEFQQKYTAPNRAETNVEAAHDVAKRATENWDSIKVWQEAIQNSGKDLTVFYEVMNTGNEKAIQLAAVIEVFDLKTLLINNLLNAHPVVSDSLKIKLESMDIYTAEGILKASKDPEISKYMEVIQNADDYKKYFIRELSNQTAKEVKLLGKKFGKPLSDFNGDTYAWAEALNSTGPTGISTLANISMQLADTGLQVTPSELKDLIAYNSTIKTRDYGEIVTNYANTGHSKTTSAERLSTREYVSFTVHREYEVFTADGTKLTVEEDIPVNMKTDCANLNIDASNPEERIKIKQVTKEGVEVDVSFDQALSRIQTKGVVIPLVGVSVLGALLRTHGGNPDTVRSRPGDRVIPIDIPTGPSTPAPVGL